MKIAQLIQSLYLSVKQPIVYIILFDIIRLFRTITALCKTAVHWCGIQNPISPRKELPVLAALIANDIFEANGRRAVPRKVFSARQPNAQLQIKRRVHIINVFLVQFLAQKLHGFSKTLEVNNLPFTEEFDHIIHIWIVRQAENIIIGYPRLLFWFVT